MRLFIAITLDEKIKEEIFKYEEDLRNKTKAKVKWVSKDNLHITLKFLGEVKEEKLQNIFDEMQETVRGFPVFNMQFLGAGTFPSGKHPKIIWIGGNSDEAVKLSKMVEGSMKKLGFSEEERNFQSHITIGRVKEGYFDLSLIQSNENIVFGNMNVSKIDLYQSHLSPRGPKHEIIKTFQF